MLLLPSSNFSSWPDHIKYTSAFVRLLGTSFSLSTPNSICAKLNKIIPLSNLLFLCSFLNDTSILGIAQGGNQGVVLDFSFSLLSTSSQVWATCLNSDLSFPSLVLCTNTTIGFIPLVLAPLVHFPHSSYWLFNPQIWSLVLMSFCCVVCSSIVLLLVLL